MADSSLSIEQRSFLALDERGDAPRDHNDAPRHHGDHHAPGYQHPAAMLQMAASTEVDDIMAAMRQSYDRSVNKKYDSTTSGESHRGWRFD